MPTLPSVRYLVQGEYDYTRSVEVAADGTARAFSGSYVTHGETGRRLSSDEREALLVAVAGLSEPFRREADGASLRHRLQIGDRAWTWRGGPDDVPEVLRAVVGLLTDIETS